MSSICEKPSQLKTEGRHELEEMLRSGELLGGRGQLPPPPALTLGGLEGDMWASVRSWVESQESPAVSGPSFTGIKNMGNVVIKFKAKTLTMVASKDLFLEAKQNPGWSCKLKVNPGRACTLPSSASCPNCYHGVHTHPTHPTLDKSHCEPLLPCPGQALAEESQRKPDWQAARPQQQFGKERVTRESFGFSGARKCAQPLGGGCDGAEARAAAATAQKRGRRLRRRRSAGGGCDGAEARAAAATAQKRGRRLRRRRSAGGGCDGAEARAAAATAQKRGRRLRRRRSAGGGCDGAEARAAAATAQKRGRRLRRRRSAGGGRGYPTSKCHFFGIISHHQQREAFPVVLPIIRNTSGGFLSLDPTIAAWETEFTPMNHTDEAHPPTFSTMTTTLFLLTAVIALGGLAGNAVVLWLLGFHLRRNAFTVYILNLAAADFLCLCCQVVDSLEALIACCSASPIPTFFTTVMTFAYLAGLSLLSAISTERCMSVLWPVWYRCHRPTHLSTIVCAVLWALALLLSILEGQYCGFLLTDFSHLWCQVFDFITAGWVMFLFGLLAGSSLALLLRILCKSQRVQLTRLYVTIVLTVLAFLLCGLPYGILWFLLIWIQDDLFAIPCHNCLVVFGLSCINSSINPIIYFFVGSFRQRQTRKRGRQTLKVVLQRALEDGSEEGESESSLPQATLELGHSLVS
ncbi:PREDICTED: uncharacterized protein LOC102185985 [Capra hircus]|uniref:uncharacterized protein LOC102185985 n=1 Tax=Capra hircus TaxID=9925 RepID=UPI0008467DEF|nr:PREDICTED: uncharacterized protein LOC102185985 [Capra hircus]